MLALHWRAVSQDMKIMSVEKARGGEVLMMAKKGVQAPYLVHR
jgi:hypothetical protein